MELHDSSKQLTPFVKVIYLRCLSWLIQRRELIPGRTVIKEGKGQAGEPGPIHRGRKGGAYKRTPQPAVSAASRATSTPLVITTRTKVQPTIWQTTLCCRRILLATAVRRSLTIGNSFTLSMVILPLWVSVFQGPPRPRNDLSWVESYPLTWYPTNAHFQPCVRTYSSPTTYQSTIDRKS